MSSSQYEALKQPASEDLSEQQGNRWTELQSLARAWKIIYALSVLLAIAIASNALLFVQLRNTQGLLDAQSYLGLQRNVPTPIPHDDRTIDDEMWDSPEFEFFTGWVALKDDFVEEKGLPSAMRFPWDSSKSIYVFHGYHSLHCVFVLRQAIMAYRDNEDQMWPFAHITHCLHVLREDAICYADDTPRYTGHLHDQAKNTVFSSGTGQIRMCRDWSKLRQFGLENSACYRRPLDHYIPLLDRYKSCPDGSKPWETQA
ncbi:MAG: hypothetical protein M1818_002499 [Claussenomyces sp. TS43310]|nr:MAG: hypothetical protein M1818_002499 [Claussenomyces sp. TS43310]